MEIDVSRGWQSSYGVSADLPFAKEACMFPLVGIYKYMHGCHEPSHNIMFISVEIVVWMEPNYGLVGPSPQPGWTKAACFPLNTVSSHNIMAWLLDSESYSLQVYPWSVLQRTARSSVLLYNSIMCCYSTQHHLFQWT